MVDYVNDGFGLFNFYTALAIEFSGIMQASYLIQFAVAALADRPIISKEEPHGILRSVFFWGRCLVSTAFLGFGFGVIFRAVIEERTTGSRSLRSQNYREQSKEKMSLQKINCKLLFSGNGQRIPGL